MKANCWHFLSYSPLGMTAAESADIKPQGTLERYFEERCLSVSSQSLAYTRLTNSNGWLEIPRLVLSVVSSEFPRLCNLRLHRISGTNTHINRLQKGVRLSYAVMFVLGYETLTDQTSLSSLLTTTVRFGIYSRTKCSTKSLLIYSINFKTHPPNPSLVSHPSSAA